MHGRKETFGAVPSDGFFTSLVNCAVSTKEHWSLGVCYMWSVARGVTEKKNWYQAHTILFDVDGACCNRYIILGYATYHSWKYHV